MFDKLNKLFHQEAYLNKQYSNNSENDDDKHKSSSLRNIFIFKFTPVLFSNDRTYFRYEDYYETPKAFLSKHFSEIEINYNFVSLSFWT